MRNQIKITKMKLPALKLYILRSLKNGGECYKQFDIPFQNKPS